MEGKYETSERRTATRLHQKIPVGYIFINDVGRNEQSERYSGNLSNFSSGGALMELNELDEDRIIDLTAGTIKILMEINIPVYAESIKVIARVAWLKKLEDSERKEKFLLGLSFIDITDEDRGRIKKYVIDSYLSLWKTQGSEADGQDTQEKA